MKRLLTLCFSVVTLIGFSTSAFADIEFWTDQTQSDRVKTIRLLAEIFESLNPDIKVKVVPVDENDLASQMAAASAANKLPDIFFLFYEFMLAFGNEGMLDSAAAKEIIEATGKSRFYRGALQLLESPQKGVYYAVPFDGWIQGIWYRADWFKKAGLAPPTTWDNIMKAAKYFYQPSKNQYGILIGTKPENYSEQVFTQFAISNNVSQFDSKGRLVFNSPQTLETLEFYKELAKYNPPGPQTWRARDYYLQGKLAMFFYSTYIMDDLALAEVAKGSLTKDHFKELSGGTFDVNLVKNTDMVSTIQHKQPAGYGVVKAFGIINKRGGKRSEAIRFAKFLLEKSSYITYLHIQPGGLNPMLRDIGRDEAYLNDPRGIFKSYGEEKIQEILSGFDSIKTFSVVDGKTYPLAGQFFAKKIIPRMIYSTIFENVPTQKALATAEKEMKSLMK